MQSQTIRAVSKGEYVKRKPEASKVYKRGDYCKASKKFELIDCDDINRVVYDKGETLVFIGFTY